MTLWDRYSGGWREPTLPLKVSAVGISTFICPWRGWLPLPFLPVGVGRITWDGCGSLCKWKTLYSAWHITTNRAIISPLELVVLPHFQCWNLRLAHDSVAVSGHQSQLPCSAGSGDPPLNDFGGLARVASLFLSCSRRQGLVPALGHPASTLALSQQWFTLPESSLAHITNAASLSILSFLALAQMCPIPSTVYQEPICCGYQSRFGGSLQVPRAEAALPYWVPPSMGPWNR